MRIAIQDLDTDVDGNPATLVQAYDMDGSGFQTFELAEFDALSTRELAAAVRASDIGHAVENDGA